MVINGWILLAVTFIVWALLHSLTAARPVKRGVRRAVGERAYAGFYRFAYNVISVLSFVPVLFVLFVYVPATVIWRVPPPWAWTMVAVQGVGLLGLATSLLYTDPFRFLGLRQVWRYLQGVPDPDPTGPFIDSGPYALVRHPLYLFSLLVLWFTPLLTLNLLLFSVLATLYFWVGARHEERRLLAEFGRQYRHYQRKVPFFLPWPRPSRRRTLP
ncbi:MAG: isoprenylcysteine carboxylmethyltransferase family protein [Anaerolineae bacterium]|nr:isoprenylcysteine carboxylmethyltransferase family protein [Anaerolineae bacterium]